MAMISPGLEAPQTDMPLDLRLGKAEPYPDETRLDFLGRLKGVALDSPLEKLPLDDPLAAFTDHIPKWRVESIISDGHSLGIAAVRSVELESPYLSYKAPGRYFDHETGQPRIIRWERPKERIVLLAKSALNGGDAAIILDIEQVAEQAIVKARSEDYKPEDKLVLTSRQREIIGLSALADKNIARQLGLSVSAIRSHLSNAGAANNMTRGKLVKVALWQNLIDIDNLPPYQPSCLSPREEQLIREHCFSTYQETTKALGIRASTIRTHWSNIYKKLGASNRVQAFLITCQKGHLD